jgi:hydrogenase maturation protein HypF
MAEHGVTERVIGVAYDGTGYGDDGTVWGAEVLVADLCDYERVAHLRAAPLPGNEIAVRTPWRSAMGYLSLEPERESSFRRAFDGVSDEERRITRQQATQRINAPLASSMGRLFDAAAAVLGIAHRSRYEGEAAMRLEGLAANHAGELLPFPVRRDGSGNGWLLDPLPLLAALGDRAVRGDDPGRLAAAFHDSVATGTTALVRTVAEATGLRTVCLGGGSFQNARLLSTLRLQLEALGLRVLWPRLLPPNDGGLSYGQAAVAAARLARATVSTLHSTHH